MSNECTCHCPVHATGELVSPSAHMMPSFASPAALVRAEKAEAKAHGAWSEAESARRQFETTLMVKWRNHPGGIKSAPASQVAELERMRVRADELFVALKRAGDETVSARQDARAAQNLHAQRVIASW